jgi:hypothetical protein
MLYLHQILFIKLLKNNPKEIINSAVNLISTELEHTIVIALG